MSLFRKKPPIELVNDFVQTTGLTNLEDSSWFVRDAIQLSVFEELLLQLAVYYTPSKDTYTSRPLTHTLAITILRQLLREYTRKIITKTVQGGTWYAIRSDLNAQLADSTVHFL